MESNDEFIARVEAEAAMSDKTTVAGELPSKKEIVRQIFRDGLKRCPQCRTHKPLDDFGRDKSKISGLRTWCRVCLSFKEAGRDYNRERRQQRDKARTYNADRRKAESLAQTAVRRGDLQKWPVCAIPECHVEKVEAHHPDYDRPLDVIWLCRSHHSFAHKLLLRSAALGSQA